MEKTLRPPPKKDEIRKESKYPKYSRPPVSYSNSSKETDIKKNPFSHQTPGTRYANQNNQTTDNQSTEEKNETNKFSSNKNISNNNNNKDTNEEMPKTQTHKTSQAHKARESSYSINPNQIPRPNPNDEVYLNNEKTPIYETNIGSVPPHSTSYYSVKETQNSSCRYIRATMNTIPISQSLINETSLLFGLCIQPFAQIPDYEQKIPIVETGDAIFRCEKCRSYINNKYNITYSSQNRQVAVCNLCFHENEFNPQVPGVKNDYFNSDLSNCPELVRPTIDFFAPKSFGTFKPFVPHYLFMIDITENSYHMKLPSYVLNSVQSNLDFIDNAENSYLGFALYDHKNIYFFYVEKEEIRLTIMGDLSEPFCPLSMKKLFLKIGDKREQIEQLIEKVNIFINDKNKNTQPVKGNRQISTLTGGAIKAGVDALMENGGRLMIFTPNPCNHGFGACMPRDKFNKENDPQKANPIFIQHDKFVEIGNKAANNRIAVDQFIFMSHLYDLSTYAVVSNLSGGHIEFYNYSMNPSVVSSSFEKLHYDITRILTRPNYYDCKFMLRFSVGIDVVEILGPFNKKLGEAFQLGGCDPDYNYFYTLRLNETFKAGQKIDIQLAILYDDNYSNKLIRIFNTSYDMSNVVSKIYDSIEVETYAKALIYKELSFIYKTDNKGIINNLEEKIINCYQYYRIKEKSNTPSNQLILPPNLKYLTLYMDAFLKTEILSDIKRPDKVNQIIYIMNKLLREPIYSSMKFLYPKFYRIDNIEGEQINQNNTIKINNIGKMNDMSIVQKPLLLRLSKDVIDFDCAYLIDNGIYIYIIVFNKIEGNFYNDVFGVENFEEVKNLGIENLDEENKSDLNQRLINIITQLREENRGSYQPLKFLFLTENGIINDTLTCLLKEDKYQEFDNYPSYLSKIHREIQAKING